MNSSSRLSWVIFDGEPVASGDVQLSPFSRAFTYGEGCFDSFKSCRGGVVRPGDHLERLQRGMRYLGLEIPDVLSGPDAFLNLLRRFLEVNNGFDDNVRIRIQVWADDQTTGFRPGNRTARYMITGSSMKSGSNHSGPGDEESNPAVSLITSRYRRIASSALPSDVKWSNGINFILAAREAEEKKAGDTLMLTHDGYVSETTIANIFWKSGETVYTPSDECDLLPGITRALTMDVLQKNGIPVRTGTFQLEELKKADTVWLCNSVKEWYPVGRIDDHIFGLDQTFWTSIHEKLQRRKKEEMHYVV